MNKTVLHISTIHPRRDTRIFYRECLSLSKNGYDTILLIADGLGNEEYLGVKILDLGKFKNRVVNFFKTYFLILKYIRDLKPDLVHFHDPELMFVGKRISLMGLPVYYDIHENVAVQILSKAHISVLLRKPLSYFYKVAENLLIDSFHLIIAEESYTNIYESKGKSINTILNLPEIKSLERFKLEERTENGIFYIGGISNVRGLDTTLEALKILKGKGLDFFMHYVGLLPDNLLEQENIEPIINNIKFYGRMDLIDGYEISKKCKVGLAVLKPIQNYIGSYPTKIFEYMSIKLPVITSNFDLYKDVVEKNNCGYCIDPFSAKELAEKIEILIKKNDKVKLFGTNGYKVVTETYNWEKQELKLINSYKAVLNNKN